MLHDFHQSLGTHTWTSSIFPLVKNLKKLDHMWNYNKTDQNYKTTWLSCMDHACNNFFQRITQQILNIYKGKPRTERLMNEWQIGKSQ